MVQRILIIIVHFSLVLLAFESAQAQTAVTTLGATNARQCFQNSAFEGSFDIGPCDAALKGENLTRSDRWKTLVNRGIILNRNGDLNAALDDFNTVIGENAEFAEAYLNRGNVWFLAGKLEQAFEDYHLALELDISEPWSAWYNIGLVHDARKDLEAGQIAYKKSLAAKPDFQPALLKLRLEK